jgi:hypothetical protein
MFKSRQRPIATPQWEHQKLAGTLALLWGNTSFEPPPIPFESFVAGVGLHDRAYGLLDNLPIGELSEEEWLKLTRKGFDLTSSDPVADMIVKMHLQRLTSYGKDPARQVQAAELAQAVSTHAQRHGLDAALFARVDRITNLCDRIAFDFCFEAPAEGEVRIFPRNAGDEEIAVRYRIEASAIEVDPWPFNVNHHTGYLVAYQLDGYPIVLEPVVLPYATTKRSQA